VLAADTRVTTGINTDGTIATNKVLTASINANAVSKITAATSTTNITLSTSYQVVQEITVTTLGGPITVNGSFLAYCQPTAAGTFGLDFYLTSTAGVGTQISEVRNYATGGGALYIMAQPVFLNTVGASVAAGTYTFTLYAKTKNNTQAGTLTVDRFLSVTELKR
jgi:hypothetical protein